MAEAEDLKSSQCGFDPHSGHTTPTGLAEKSAGLSSFHPRAGGYPESSKKREIERSF